MNHEFGQSSIHTLQFPHSKDVDKNKLLQIFQKTTTSYKYLFFMALLKIIRRDNFESKIISFDDLARNMLAISWYPYKLFKLSFGLTDRIPNELDKIHVDSIESLDMSSYMLYNKKISKILSSANVSHELLRYVPYRLIQPFVANYLQGIVDGKKNELTNNIARERFDEIRPFYYIDTNNKAIVLHPAWVEYFYENYELVESFSKWEWLSYMQKRNPSVPNLQSKLFPQMSRERMAVQTRFWKSVVEAKSIQCIYSKQRITLENFSLDHFIPWSFVAHNQLWNLIPTLKSVNSSKLNNLPSLDSYFDAYAALQYEGLSLYRQLSGNKLWKKTVEPYQLDLKIDYNEILNNNVLKKQLKSTINPLVAIASNMGFSTDWVYKISNQIGSD
jgi:hypothetical protein